MSNELTVNVEVDYNDQLTPDAQKGAFSIEDLLISLSTVKLLDTVISINTSETAIELGDISTRGMAIFVNLDTTNYIEVKVATSGAIFAKLFPKRADSSTAQSGLNFCIVHLGSGAQSPYAIANSAI